jgi:hypothetical protein
MVSKRDFTIYRISHENFFYGFDDLEYFENIKNQTHSTLFAALFCKINIKAIEPFFKNITKPTTTPPQYNTW